MLNITTIHSLFAVERTGVAMCRLSVAVFAFLLIIPYANAQTSSRIEETEITLVGAWDTESHDEYSDGRAVLANFSAHDPSAHATFEFEGTGITWIGARTHNGGLFDWIIDEATADERSGTVNTYIDGVERFSTEVLVTDLSPGVHTFKFLSLGIHGDSMLSGSPSETYIDAFDVVMNDNTPTVTVVAASATYPASTEEGGFTSTSDDPLGPFSGQSVMFRGLNEGGVAQVYRYRLDYEQIVTLDSVVVEGAAWAGDTISLLDEQGIEITDIIPLSHNGGNSFFNQIIDVADVTGQTFFLEEWNTDTNWRYRSNIEVRLKEDVPADEVHVRVRAIVDGRSQINIQDNQLWWHHFQDIAPGKHNGLDEPTIINAFDWFPVWPFNDEFRSCDCESDKFDLADAGVQLTNDLELLELRVVDARISASLIQSPSAANGFHTIIELDDDTSGSATYQVVAVFGSKSPIKVPGTSNPWLAGMPDESTAAGGDVAPDQSPVLAPVAFTPGVAISFSASGLVSHCNCGLNGPDGDISDYMPHAMENGMPDTNMPLNALAGVFLGPDQPDLSQPPSGLDFGVGGNVADGINYTDLSPDLKQVFFIGDGLTDAGASQQITPPAGATRLYLGTNDLEGWYDNIGEFEVEVSDGTPPVNNVPAAANDSADADTGVSVVIDVLENDQGLADTPIVVAISANPANGTAIAGADNNITYTSNPGFEGDDGFQYTATDRDGDASSATVTVTVVDPNANVIPLAIDDSADVNSGETVNIDVIANDQGLSDLPIAVSISADPANGSAQVLTDNHVAYTADNTFSGTDTFEYTVMDVDGDASSATVIVTVIDPDANVLPIANDDSANVWVDFQFGGNVVIDVLANDQGLDDDPVSVEIYSSPGVGSVVVLANNRISYTTYDSSSNEDSFQYFVTDANGDWASAKVTITIRPSTLADEQADNTNKKKGGGSTDPLWLLVLLLLILKSRVRHFAGFLQLIHGTQRDVDSGFYAGCIVKNSGTG